MDAHRGLELFLTPGLIPADWDRLEQAHVTPAGDEGVDVAAVLQRQALLPVQPVEITRQLRAMDRAAARLIFRWEPGYPAPLRTIDAAPPAIFVRGRLPEADTPVVAIVGTRKPSAAGSAFAHRLARTLSLLGVVVVSGLARGIDTAAHAGALDADGMTVAVLGTGIDVVYPPENAALMDRIARSGGIVSEQPCGMRGFSYVFPRRNRIISGMSDAVVVVQGGAKSGALITARWALDQGREVGAVPGFPGDFRSEGPNRLIREGAFVVEDAVDVVVSVKRIAERVRMEIGRRAREESTGLQGDTARVYDLVSGMTTVDDVAAATGFSIAYAQSLLEVLEIDGRLQRDEAGNYARSG